MPAAAQAPKTSSKEAPTEYPYSVKLMASLARWSSRDEPKARRKAAAKLTTAMMTMVKREEAG
jgi:hypothetical protein